MKYTPIFKNQSEFKSRFDTGFCQPIKRTRSFPELVVLHLFCSKKYIKSSMEKSFPSLTSEENLVNRNLYPKMPQFRNISNILYLLLNILELNLLRKRESNLFNTIFLKRSFEKFSVGNPLYELSENKNSDSFKIYHLNKYLKHNSISEEELIYIITRIASYYLYLYSDYKRFYIKQINNLTTIKLYKDKRILPVNNLNNLLFEFNNKDIESRIIKSYNIRTIKKSTNLKNISLKYFYMRDRRVYYNILWRKSEKPKYLNYCHGFYASLYGAFEQINNYYVVNKVDSDNINSELNRLLVYISTELIFNFNVDLQIKKGE